MCCKAAAGIVGASVEVAVSAVSEDKGTAALGTNAGNYFAVRFALGGIDITDIMDAMLSFTSFVFLGVALLAKNHKSNNYQYENDT